MARFKLTPSYVGVGGPQLQSGVSVTTGALVVSLHTASYIVPCPMISRSPEAVWVKPLLVSPGLVTLGPVWLA